MQPLLQYVRNTFRLPTPCMLCNTMQRGQHPICTHCIAALPQLGPSCSTCTRPVARQQERHCAICRLQPATVDRIFSAYRFEEPIRSILHEFKYQEGLYLTAFIATLMQHALPAYYNTECLIPIPLHAKRLKQRGFNQANLLAIHLGKQLGVVVNQNLCKKIIHTSRQAQLTARARQKNLRNAFQVTPMSYRHVTLIDDLVTTGSTANELACTLKRAGVTRVDLWCCAKACLD